jgi:predicted transcriptional regulator
MSFVLSKRKKAILEVMSKPGTPTEIMEKINLSRNNSLTPTLKQLCILKIMRCINPSSRTGRIYGLTYKGLKMRRQLFANAKFTPYIEPKLNWSLYSWIVSGKQKKAILKGMKQPLPLKYIRENAQNYDPRISRMNAHDIIQLFVKKGIVRKLKQHERIFYSLTKTGEALRNQLFES